jgi:hypothetical protein
LHRRADVQQTRTGDRQPLFVALIDTPVERIAELRDMLIESGKTLSMSR